jgi:hypothetical protein
MRFIVVSKASRICLNSPSFSARRNEEKNKNDTAHKTFNLNV